MRRTQKVMVIAAIVMALGLTGCVAGTPAMEGTPAASLHPEATAPVQTTPVEVNPATGRNMTCTGQTVPGGSAAALAGPVLAAAAYCEAIAFVSTYTLDPQMLEHDFDLSSPADFDHVLPFLTPYARPQWQAIVRKAFSLPGVPPDRAAQGKVLALVMFGVGPQVFPDGYAQLSNVSFREGSFAVDKDGRLDVGFTYRADLPVLEHGKTVTFHIVRKTHFTMQRDPTSPTLPWLIADWSVDAKAL